MDSYVGVLFSQCALTGENGFGYYSNSDPRWFEWRETRSCEAECFLHRALRSPLITVWHVVAQSKPTGKWRYRGGFLRHTCFTPDQSTTGLLLERLPGADIMEPHTSLQEPLCHHVQYRVPLPYTPLGRAKFAMCEALGLVHQSLATVTMELTFPEAVNIWVYNTTSAYMELPSFFLNLLFDQVYHNLDEEDRKPELVRPPVDTHSEVSARAIWAELPHAPDGNLASYSDSDEE
ncbi:hypothetical protein WJX74_000382 [Apatococcus lobatus]|uniref:Uncharacterized protein n=1 Tax=Apatococcus lobatus TaxID=904363 RepID=A0AAW1QZ63_9CHLO